MLDLNDFVITRKRKKYKFAKFANSPLCFEQEEWSVGSVDCIEIGAGNGLFSVQLAERHPQLQFVAIDIKGDRLQKGAYIAEEKGLKNVFFVRARADQITDLFTPNSIGKIWVTFADPFGRKKSSGRRLTHPSFLKQYKNLLKPEGSLLIKHDNPDFFTWTLEQLVAQNWHITQLSFDLHESDLDDEYKLLTTYEERWLEDTRTIHFVRALPMGTTRQL